MDYVTGENEIQFYTQARFKKLLARMMFYPSQMRGLKPVDNTSRPSVTPAANAPKGYQQDAVGATLAGVRGRGAKLCEQPQFRFFAAPAGFFQQLLPGTGALCFRHQKVTP